MMKQAAEVTQGMGAGLFWLHARMHSPFMLMGL